LHFIDPPDPEDESVDVEAGGGLGKLEVFEAEEAGLPSVGEEGFAVSVFDDVELLASPCNARRI